MEIPNFVRELLKVSLIMRTNEKLQINKEINEKQHVFWQPWLNTEESSKQSTTTKQLPTTKWKRDRRSRLPEYTRKSDPKIAETFGSEQLSPSSSSSPDGSNPDEIDQISNGNCQKSHDTPLDMSMRQRGLPPSYAQTISNPNYRSTYRPSVIQNKTPVREELPPGISMCDPIIDEHFRRSLGKDYLTLFSNNNISSKENVTVKAPVTTKITNNTTNNVIELMDSTGLSVDDHFAKALGDTWLKLNKKENEIKNNSNENSLVST